MNHSFIEKSCHKIGLITLACLLSTAANAEWTLNSELSNLHFISIKKNTVGEVHHFKQLTGSLNDKNRATVTIPLNSVETLIPIRNERMQAVLFESQQFPLATITTTLNADAIKALASGATTVQTLNLVVTLHGETQTYPGNIQITKLDSGTVMAATQTPIIVNAVDFKLLKGIEDLRELAGLPSIASAVPVTATLIFKQSK